MRDKLKDYSVSFKVEDMTLGDFDYIDFDLLEVERSLDFIGIGAAEFLRNAFCWKATDYHFWKNEFDRLYTGLSLSDDARVILNSWVYQYKVLQEKVE